MGVYISRTCFPDEFEPSHETPKNLGFPSSPTQTGLYSHKSRLEQEYSVPAIDSDWVTLEMNVI